MSIVRIICINKRGDKMRSNNYYLKRIYELTKPIEENNEEGVDDEE